MSASTPRSPSPVVSVLVLSWNTRDLTLACLEALEREEPRHAREVLVLDNASEDGSADAIRERAAGVCLDVAGENLGYAIGNNRLAQRAEGRYLCLLGSDTEVRPGAIDAMVDFLEVNPGHAAAAPRLVGPDGIVQRSCMRWPTLGVALVYDMAWRQWPLLRRVEDRYFCRDLDHVHDTDVDQPPGTCFLVRKEVWEELGGLDGELWLFFNDVDLCRRIQRAGRRVRYLAGPEVLHHGGASTGGFDRMVEVWARDRIRYYEKHYGALGRVLVRSMIRLRAIQE